MTRLLLVLVGGGIGSAGRYFVVAWVGERWGTGFPWGTLAVNVAGGFVIGVVATLADDVRAVGAHLRLFLITGVLGGFTTFSAFSLETLRLVEDHQLARAAVYVLGSVVLALAAAWAGVLSVRALHG
jgi:CrcB protein